MGAEENGEGVGRRVRSGRKLAGLTQQQLAARAHVSASLVKAVEQGRVPASPAFVAATARALGLSTTDLTDQPYPATAPEDRRIHAVIPALRRELISYQRPVDEGVFPRPLAELRAAVAEASRQRHAVQIGTLGLELPALLVELRSAAVAAESPEREQLFGLLAEAYAAAGQVAWKLGYSDLSSLATERIEWASRESGDPLAMAAADWYQAGELITVADWGPALAFLDGARERIAPLVAEGGKAAVGMHGILHLKSGLAAARSGDADTSDAHLHEAREAAKRTGERDDYRLAFGPTNVAIWSVGLAVERRDGTEAVKRARGMQFAPGTPQERIGHHWIDLARGFQLHGDRTRALDALNIARRTSPQQTRFHPQVRETVVTLAEQDRRRTDTLAGFARWAGVRL
jgi:transcriptional regulator with XRE-family HTH domain